MCLPLDKLKYKCFTIFTVIIITQKLAWGRSLVYRIVPSKNDHLKILSNLICEKHFNFWSPIRTDYQPVDLMVGVVEQRSFQKLLVESAIKYEILIPDVERALLDESRSNRGQLENGEISFIKFHRHNEINDYLNKLAQIYSTIVSVETIGKSYEGRDLNVIKVSKDPSANKPIIFIDAAIHAREWIGTSVTLYAIQQLLKNLELLEKIDWHFLPIVNPDGYEYSHKNFLTRMWRKNRSRGHHCYGTDINRNFNFNWAGNGSSDDECAETYRGTRPFSENESLALSTYILRNNKYIRLYLSFHSYGQLILYPPCTTSEDTLDNSSELHRLGIMVAKAIENFNRTKYEVGSSSHLLYLAGGVSTDWVKNVAGVRLAYTFELPKSGSLGFNTPNKDILSVAKETWEGLLLFHQYVSQRS